LLKAFYIKKAKEAEPKDLDAMEAMQLYRGDKPKR
jgi:hypothetical protein